MLNGCSELQIGSKMPKGVVVRPSQLESALPRQLPPLRDRWKQRCIHDLCIASKGFLRPAEQRLAQLQLA